MGIDQQSNIFNTFLDKKTIVYSNKLIKNKIWVGTDKKNTTNSFMLK